MAVKFAAAAYVLLFVLAGTSYAAHPLITDDTGTQGKGRFQVEFVGEYGHDKKDGVTTDEFVVPTPPVLSYGIDDRTDLIFSISYQSIETRQNGVTAADRGVSDALVQLKWRFCEKDGFSFAVKPGFSLPTANENEGLGNGKMSYSMFFIVTKEMAPWAVHLNLGYIRNEYKLQRDEDTNEKDIWHVSLASEVKVVKDLKAVANIGTERNHDKASNTNPAFLLGGLIYSIVENVDIDFGVKGGLTRPETDISYLAGISWRF